MAELQIVKMDEGGVNARIIAKETKTDFRRVEAASLKMPGACQKICVRGIARQ